MLTFQFQIAQQGQNLPGTGHRQRLAQEGLLIRQGGALGKTSLDLPEKAIGRHPGQVDAKIIGAGGLDGDPTGIVGKGRHLPRPRGRLNIRGQTSAIAPGQDGQREAQTARKKSEMGHRPEIPPLSCRLDGYSILEPGPKSLKHQPGLFIIIESQRRGLGALGTLQASPNNLQASAKAQGPDLLGKL